MRQVQFLSNTPTMVAQLQTLFGLATALCVLHLAWTYPYGAPDQSCSDMLPLHYVNKSWTNPIHSPQKGRLYFSIHVDRTYASSPGEMILVTIKADDHYFEGFLIQAHNSYSSEQMGEFVTFTSDTKTACMGKAVTHSDHKHYMEANFHWIAPAVREYTCVNFVATIVKGYSTYFMGVTSETVCIAPVDSYGNPSDNIKPMALSLLFLIAIATARFVRRA